MTMKTSLDLLQIYCTILQQMQQKLALADTHATIHLQHPKYLENVYKVLMLVEILCGIFAHMCTSVCV